MDTIKENDCIIIKKMYEDVMRIARVEKETNFFNGKCKVNLMNLVGVEYGSILEFNKKSREMVPITLTSEEMFELSTSQQLLSTNGSNNADTIVMENDSKDNRHLHDDGKSQKLTAEEIESLKDGEMTDEQIISSLVSNSITFADKSAFSQAKYIKKKRQKYSNYWKLYKPSIRLLVEMYYNQSPSKINFIRIDTLGQMLNAVNVRSGGAYIIIDNFVGLLCAAVMDRLVGTMSTTLANVSKCEADETSSPKHANSGSIIQVYTDQGPCSSWRSCIESLNIPQNVVSRVMKSIQIKSVFNLLHGIEDVPKHEHRKNKVWNEVDDDQNADMDHNSSQDDDVDGDNDDEDRKSKKRAKLDVETIKLKKKLDEKAKRRMERKEEESSAKDVLNHKLIDGALINIRSVDPSSIMDIILPFLAPSAPFAVFCINPEPLTHTLFGLKGRCVNLKIHETWLRRYQVLPGRTRPDMMMSGSGGYILTGIKLAPEAVSLSPSKKCSSPTKTPIPTEISDGQTPTLMSSPEKEINSISTSSVKCESNQVLASVGDEMDI